MRWRMILTIAAALSVTGCAPAALVPVQGAASFVESAGSTAGGFWTIGSTTRLNGADADLANAQARVTLARFPENLDDEQHIARERVITSRLLRQMAKTYDDPLLTTMAAGVEGGGDPDFSFKNALEQDSEMNDGDRPPVKHGQALLIVLHARIKEKAVAQSPQFSGGQLRWLRTGRLWCPARGSRSRPVDSARQRPGRRR